MPMAACFDSPQFETLLTSPPPHCRTGRARQSNAGLAPFAVLAVLFLLTSGHCFYSAKPYFDATKKKNKKLPARYQ